MSSTIIHVSGKTPGSASTPSLDEKDPFLVALGDRVRKLRARRGMTRKVTADNAGISERHLANLEHGVGNASILVLLHLSRALQCPLAELIGDVTTSSRVADAARLAGRS